MKRTHHACISTIHLWKLCAIIFNIYYSGIWYSSIPSFIIVESRTWDNSDVKCGEILTKFDVKICSFSMHENDEGWYWAISNTTIVDIKIHGVYFPQMYYWNACAMCSLQYHCQHFVSCLSLTTPSALNIDNDKLTRRNILILALNNKWIYLLLFCTRLLNFLYVRSNPKNV